MNHPTKTRAAFTLAELVVMVMILGIIAAIAAPKLLGTSRTATDQAVRQTLTTVRNAIDIYAAEHNGKLPGADGLEITFLADIQDYIRGGTLPRCPIDASLYNDVYILAGSDAPGANSGVGTHAYCYDPDTGEFRINCPDLSSDGVTTYAEF
jgi:general secretion pathway protein G